MSEVRNLMRLYTETLIALVKVRAEIAAHPQHQPPKYLQQQAEELEATLRKRAEWIDQKIS